MIAMNSRTNDEIIESILESANGGASITRIIYKSFLCHTQVKRYLNMLIVNDMMEYPPDNRMFKTSEKGLKFLRLHKELKGQISWERKELTVTTHSY